MLAPLKRYPVITAVCALLGLLSLLAAIQTLGGFRTFFWLHTAPSAALLAIIFGFSASLVALGHWVWLESLASTKQRWRDTPSHVRRHVHRRGR